MTGKTTSEAVVVSECDVADINFKNKLQIYKEKVEKLGLIFNELPVLLNGELFEICSLKNQTVKAKCQLCVKTNTLGCSITSTSNLLKHLKVCMKEVYY